MLVRLSRVAPNLPCSVFFSELEWKSVIAATSKSLTALDKVPTIQEMLIMIAKLGGYLNRKGDPAPGATVIWRGFTYLRGFMDAFQMFVHTADADSGNFVKKTYG